MSETHVALRWIAATTQGIVIVIMALTPRTALLGYAVLLLFWGRVRYQANTFDLVD